jgi:hypothetical protein
LTVEWVSVIVFGWEVTMSQTAVNLKQAPLDATWETSFTRLDLRDVSKSPLKGGMVDGEARARLVTRTGFEKHHIFTSQIATG